MRIVLRVKRREGWVKGMKKDKVEKERREVRERVGEKG